MKKIIAVVILFSMGALLIFNPSILRQRAIDQTSTLFDDTVLEEEVLPMAQKDFAKTQEVIKKLQITPDGIVRLNAMIMKKMYSGSLEEEDIELLARVQRVYYHEDLLEINPEEVHLLSVVREVKAATESENWIIDFEIGSPIISENNPNVAIVQITYIPNSLGISTDIYQQYLLERQGGLWYIKGWVGIEESQVQEIND